MDVDALEFIFFDGAVDFRQRLFDAKRIVARQADEAVGVTSGVLGDFFELSIHVHPLVAVGPHLGLGDENLFHAGIIHLGEHSVETVVLRQAADGFFHAADELAFLRFVPPADELRRGDVVHEVDGLYSVTHLFILRAPDPHLNPFPEGQEVRRIPSPACGRGLG
jgi:hypothetical protein